MADAAAMNEKTHVSDSADKTDDNNDAVVDDNIVVDEDDLFGSDSDSSDSVKKRSWNHRTPSLQEYAI